MRKYTGLAGAPGQSLLKAVLFTRRQISVTHRLVEDPREEIQRFHAVRDEYIQHLHQLYSEALDSLGEDAAKIFKAYEIIARDDIFFKKPLKQVEEQGVAVDYAIEQEKQRVCNKFAAMDDPYMKERATDIGNVCEELIRRINGVVGEVDITAAANEPVLLVAEDLTPEDTVRFDKSRLGGFVTEKGGVTSHAVILAKTLGIPAVVGATGILEGVESGQAIYINGDKGFAIVEPDEGFVQSFQGERVRLEEQGRQYVQMARREAVTADGRKVSVCINSGDEDSVEAFDAEACDGIGLFRTEFLFMGQQDYPDEELQFETYREIARRAKGKEVIIRTLDIGGDKQLDYMQIPGESNPFLGYRAIRICLDREAMFLTQLRAILRASAFGQIRIMLPMIVTCEELLQSKALVEQAKAELREKSIPFDESIQVGIMVETPASVLICDGLAKHADFFSIGTNDLIQYITACDRMNHKVQYLYDSCNLSVLRAVYTVIQSGHKAGIPVGMCGEMASEERLVPLLLGMGLDEFSVVPSQVGRIKHQISGLDYRRMQRLAEEVVQMESINAVRGRLEDLEGRWS